MKINLHIYIYIIIFFSHHTVKLLKINHKNAIKKENKKLSKFLQKPENELKIVMGKS